MIRPVRLVLHSILVAMLWLAGVTPSHAQRPMIPMLQSAPALNQLQAIQTARRQARTILYREALDELRRDPLAAELSPCPAGAPADAPCAPRTEASGPGPEAEPRVRSRVALLIGNNAYAEPIPALETPAADVERVGAILRERFGYRTSILLNASKAELARALNRLAAETSVEDSVLIFYAGHGYLMDETSMGYWLPVDASVKTAANWVSNADISRFLAAIPARQLILISDSCYSGSLTRELRVDRSQKIDPSEVLRKRSVLVLTSGGDEPVSDEGKGGHSVFAGHLIDILERSRGLATGAAVAGEVRTRVLRDFPQTPQYGAAVSAGHVPGGEYLFETATR